MPRVNRDLQRRMAARRERERRRPPTERRYRFTAPEPALASDEPRLNGDETAAAPQTVAPAARSVPKNTPKPFSDYKAEYAYVLRDLRRIALVIGSLLAILIVLNFVLPR